MRTFGVLTAVVAGLVWAPTDVLAQDDLSGEWTLDARNDADSPTFRLRLFIEIVQDGQTLTVTCPRCASNVVGNLTGALNESDVRLQWERTNAQGTSVNIVFTGTVAEGSMSGSVELGGGGTGVWSAQRGGTAAVGAVHPAPQHGTRCHACFRSLRMCACESPCFPTRVALARRSSPVETQ